jgi:hypothetical protein
MEGKEETTTKSAKGHRREDLGNSSKTLSWARPQ